MERFNGRERFIHSAKDAGGGSSGEGTFLLLLGRRYFERFHGQTFGTAAHRQPPLRGNEELGSLRADKEWKAEMMEMEWVMNGGGGRTTWEG